MFTKKMSARMLTVAGATALVVGAMYGDRAVAATDDLDVTATVTATCSVVATPVAFGAYDPVVTHAAAPNTAQGNLSVKCTDGETATIGLDEGDNEAGGSTPAVPLRQMSNGAAGLLPYQLYVDASYANVWGDDTDTEDYTGTGVATNVVVYGRILAAQNVPAGSYADIVTVTVTL